MATVPPNEYPITSTRSKPSFSITPAGVGPIKAMVRSLDAAACRTRVQALLQKPPANLRKALGDWARRHRVAIG